MTTPESDAERLATIDEKLRRDDTGKGGWMLSHSDGRFLRLLLTERAAEIARLTGERDRCRDAKASEVARREEAEAEIARLRSENDKIVIDRCKAPYEDEYGEHSCEPSDCRLRSQAAPSGKVTLVRKERVRFVVDPADYQDAPGEDALELASKLVDDVINRCQPLRPVVAAAITAVEREATERAYATLDHRLKTFIAGVQFNRDTIGAQTADELLAALSLVLTEYRADRAISAPDPKP